MSFKRDNKNRAQGSVIELLLGSKELGTNVLELQCVMLVNHDQNI